MHLTLWMKEATCHTATHLQSAYVTPELMITTRLAAGIRHCARNAATKYAATHTAAHDTHLPLDLIGTALASVAAYAIFPLQDVLCVGAEGRMNTPGIGAGNWSWRYQQSALKGELADELRGMTILYGRY